MTTSHSTGGLQSHVSIDTADLVRSRDFYTALFGCDPALVRHDYVRFWPPELGLVLGLNASSARPRATGSVQHLGILFPDATTLRAARERLAQAGFTTPGEEHTECCYAELDQFWATDPSGVRWELFLAHQEVVAAPSACDGASACCSPATSVRSSP